MPTRIPDSLTGHEQRPTLLMLSHCVPEASGSADRARAWQLLTIASRRHDVHLVCLLDAPVRLEPWRAIYRLTHRLDIKPPNWPRRLAGPRLARAIREHYPALGIHLTREDMDTDAATRFDIALATHPALWAELKRISALKRMCDLHVPASEAHRHAARHGPIRWRWHHRHLNSVHQQLEMRIADQADRLLLAHEAYLQLPGIERTRASVLRPAVDLSAIGRAARQPAPASHSPSRPRPCILIHAGMNTLGARRQALMLQSELNSTLSSPGRARFPGTVAVLTGDREGELADADVVCVPESCPASGEWAALAALALDKPVVLPNALADRLALPPSPLVRRATSASDWSKQIAAAVHAAPSPLRSHELIPSRHRLDQSRVDPFSPDDAPPLRLAQAA